MKWCNCLAFVLWKRWKYGGYIVERASHAHRWIPHFMWTASVEGCVLEEYVPLEPKKDWRALIDALCFKGEVRIKTGDKD